MTIPEIARWSRVKGIGLVATGDWTHPLWLKEIQHFLKEDGTGILTLKEQKNTQPGNPSFLLSTELSCIYSQSGKTRRVHVLVWVPTIAGAVKINQELTRRGCNILSDGRPILGLTLIDLSELILTVEPKALIIPAHIWTPWFSVYGKMGGFESLSEAFGPYAKHIAAVETGLSSSPEMNWRIKELDNLAIVSFSDAHSGAKLGREATIFEMPDVTFENIALALSGNSTPHSPHIASTIEFYPEEGKYHYTGHRACNIRLTPEEVTSKGTTCPVCGKPLTQGVMQRVEELASRTSGEIKVASDEIHSVRTLKSEALKKRPPFVMSVPLMEIIAEAIGSPTTSNKTKVHYDRLTSTLAGEFSILLKSELTDIASNSTPEIADGVRKVRKGDIVVDPGYDGVFGVVKIWKSEKEKALVDTSKEQLSFL